MKKKEILILAVIALVSVLVIVMTKILPQTKEIDPNALPQEEAQGQWVAVIHRNQVEKWFDSGVDAEYEITGDYGKMTIEVKDGRWHVAEVECPNHVCENMGWDDGNNLVPISCIPNSILIGTEVWAENYLQNEN